jgi:hypothetical protein
MIKARETINSGLASLTVACIIIDKESGSGVLFLEYTFIYLRLLEN